MPDVRGHREGSLFQRKTGRGRGTWQSVVTMRDGRRVSRTTHSRDEAKAELAELLRLRDAGAAFTGRVRLSDYLERWVSDVRSDLAPSTWRKHESILRVHVQPALGAVRLSELSTPDVNRLLGGISLDPQTVRHVRSTLRRALADAVRSGLVDRNVAALSRPPRLTRRERAILDASQARLLIESTRTTRYGPLWTILVTTGLRISEALGLAWSDVDFGGYETLRGARTQDPRAGGARDGLPTTARNLATGPSLTVTRQLAREDGEWVRRPPKTAKGRRTIPLTPLGVEAFRAQREQQDADLGGTPRPIDGLVFTTTKGAPHHETNTLAALHRDLATAGLPKVSQHSLRHSAASLLLREGVPLPTISAILGHSTIRVTMDIYAHVMEESKHDASDAMQRALG